MAGISTPAIPSSGGSGGGGSVTQGTNPWVVSGAVTANAGTNLNTSLLATAANQTNGNQITQIQDSAANSLSVIGEGFTFADSKNGLLIYGRTEGSGGSAVAHAIRTDASGNLLAAVTTVTTVGAVTAITNALPAGTNLMGKVGIDQTTPGTTNGISIAQIGATTVVNGGLAGSLAIGGTVGNNVAPTGNPIPLAGIAASSEPSANTTTRVSQLITDLVGKLIVLPYANPENFVNGTTAAITDTTTTSIIAAQAAGVRTYITQITVTNSHATVGTFVKVTDGASTILWEGYAASAGGGATATFPTPLRGSTATAVNAICVTTGANVIVSVSGYKGI